MMAQVSIGGKDVLVPVTTIGSLATGAAVTSTLQPWRSLDSGRSSSQQGSLSLFGSLTSPDVTILGSQSFIDSDEDDCTSSACGSRSVQDAFTELVETYDQSPPSSEQQRRAMNHIWSFYAAHADELEACALDLEALLCSKPASVLEQGTPFTRLLTSPSELSQQQCGKTKHAKLGYRARWKFLHRRSRSMS
ncbi:hypothetical protein ABBQ38_012538 [Trebouxia sp. C0009 RCD-2024]